MTYATGSPTQLVEISPHLFLGVHISRIDGLSPKDQCVEMYLMENQEGQKIRYTGYTVPAEKADSVAEAFEDFASMIRELVEKER